MSAERRTFDGGAARAAAPAAWWRSRGWRIVGALSVTETVSWGILYYAFAVSWCRCGATWDSRPPS